MSWNDSVDIKDNRVRITLNETNTSEQYTLTFPIGTLARDIKIAFRDVILLAREQAAKEARIKAMVDFSDFDTFLSKPTSR